MNNVERKIIKPKLGLLELAKQLGNVSQACKTFGCSRDTFYRYQDLYEKGGEEALKEISRKGRPQNKNRVSENTEKAVIEVAIKFPAYGQLRASNELRKEGILISSGGVRSVWLRNDLETIKKRLKALSTRVAQDGIILTEEQVTALEKAKNLKEAHGEIETEHPGYLGSQDTYYVGHIKGVGKIYQQTFVDTYSRVAIVKLYDQKTALTAADTMNDRILPFFESHNIPLLRVLTDRGTEYCGKVENHPYELYLGTENVDHTRTKTNSPQTNGICERFHRTMKDECYNIIFRKKFYNNLEDLQSDVDNWLKTYNELRPHSGKYCYGKTPYQTFLDSKKIAKEKNISNLFDNKEDNLNNENSDENS